MIAETAGHVESFRGLRPLNPARDLPAVAELLRTAFREEIGHQEASWLREMETIGAFTPLAWLMGQVSDALGGALGGFVWEEDGRIVGNVTISRLSATNWLISNVAVHPDYRRRGIARQLMEAALDWMRSRNARWAVLQVRHDNEAAKRLYENLGFVVVDTTTELQRWGVPHVDPVRVPEGYTLRSWRSGDGRRAYELVRALTPELALEITPLHPRDFEVDFLSRLLGGLARLLGLSTTQRRVVDDADGTLMATLKVHTGYRRQEIEFVVHPQARGRLEEALVTRALQALRRRQGRVYSEVNAQHTQAVAALEAYGFEEIRTLDRMALCLEPVRRIPIR